MGQHYDYGCTKLHKLPSSSAGKSHAIIRLSTREAGQKGGGYVGFVIIKFNVGAQKKRGKLLIYAEKFDDL